MVFLCLCLLGLWQQRKGCEFCPQTVRPARLTAKSHMPSELILHSFPPLYFPRLLLLAFLPGVPELQPVHFFE